MTYLFCKKIFLKSQLALQPPKRDNHRSLPCRSFAHSHRNQLLQGLQKLYKIEAYERM